MCCCCARERVDLSSVSVVVVARRRKRNRNVLLNHRVQAAREYLLCSIILFGEIYIFGAPPSTGRTKSRQEEEPQEDAAAVETLQTTTTTLVLIILFPNKKTEIDDFGGLLMRKRFGVCTLVCTLLSVKLFGDDMINGDSWATSSSPPFSQLQMHRQWRSIRCDALLPEYIRTHKRIHKRCYSTSNNNIKMRPHRCNCTYNNNSNIKKMQSMTPRKEKGRQRRRRRRQRRRRRGKFQEFHFRL